MLYPFRRLLSIIYGRHGVLRLIYGVKTDFILGSISDDNLVELHLERIDEMRDKMLGMIEIKC